MSIPQQQQQQLASLLYSSETLSEIVDRILGVSKIFVSSLDRTSPQCLINPNQAIGLAESDGIRTIAPNVVAKFDQSITNLPEEQKEAFLLDVFDKVQNFLSLTNEMLHKNMDHYKSRYDWYGTQLDNNRREFDRLLPGNPFTILNAFDKYFTRTRLTMREYCDGRDVIQNGLEFSRFFCGLMANTRLYAVLFFIHDAALVRFIDGDVEEARSLITRMFDNKHLHITFNGNRIARQQRPN
ncbi:hypothetical protein H4219_004731 [Mycoemilia scoparia]|uniref:Uncharacterized protein n=1 Tax=Mycoemilia scoparia TaxID=417184 RepID=A0A9W7ZXA7_9FUNG|nr:hypothetical protein H4219_004731 [Mycoemilia scoparia]